MAAEGVKYPEENREKDGEQSTESGLPVPRSDAGRRRDPGAYRPRTRSITPVSFY